MKASYLQHSFLIDIHNQRQNKIYVNSLKKYTRNIITKINKFLGNSQEADLHMITSYTYIKIIQNVFSSFLNINACVINDSSRLTFSAIFLFEIMQKNFSSCLLHCCIYDLFGAGQ